LTANHDTHPRIKALVELLLTIEPDPDVLAAAERGEDLLEFSRRRRGSQMGMDRLHGRHAVPAASRTMESEGSCKRHSSA